MNAFGYLKDIFSDIKIASITPSSHFSVQRVCKSIDFSRTNVIVEYGPGLGVFTKYLLDRLGPSAKVIAFETNARFAAELKKLLPDPRLTVVERSAEDVLEVLRSMKIEHADVVISGIPFSLIPVPVKEGIIQHTFDALHDDGQFLTYQNFPPAASFDRFLKSFLDKVFDVVRVEYEFRNLPPLRIYESRKRSRATHSGAQ